MKKTRTYLMLALLTFAATSSYASDEGGVMAINPSPSPDAQRIVFSADYQSPDSQLHLWTARMDGSNLHQLPAPPSSKIEEEASWSTTNTIAFSANDGNVSNLWSMAPDGSHLHQLTSKSLNNHSPAWSPDGSKIAFVSDRAGTNDLWISNADGSSPHQLTTLIGEESNPSFSPDGSQIVFSETLNEHSSLWIVNSDGTGLHALTDTAFEDWRPSWGSKGIVFSSNRDGSGNWRFWIVNPDGKGLRKFGDMVGIDPVWTKNGDIVYSDETAGIDGAISVITLFNPAGSKRIIVDREGFDAHISIRPFRGIHDLSLDSLGKLRVAILSTPSFNAVTQIDQSTLRFGRTGNEASLYKCYRNGKDINGDGIPDLICRFQISKTKLQLGDRGAKMRFHDLNGTAYEASDTIHVVPHFDLLDKLLNFLDDDDNKDSD